MKIALDISQVVHEGTGVGSYTANLVEKLISIDTENKYFLVGISLRKHKDLVNFCQKLKKKKGDIEYKVLPIPPRIGEIIGNAIHFPPIDRILRNADIFHSSDWIQPKVHAKKVTTVHDLVVYRYPETSDSYIIRVQKRRLYWVSKECDLVLADSSSTMNDLVKIIHINPKKIEVVYPSLDESFVSEERNYFSYLKAKYQLFDDYILTVGTLEPRKNLKTTIAAFEKFLKNPLIASRKKPIELVVIGKKGWEKNHLPAKYVHYLGFINQKDLRLFYNNALFFVFPSLYEGFGMPIIEAFSQKCPVICSDRGSLAEVAGTGAVFVDPQSPDDLSTKMVQMIVDDELKKTMVKKGLERMKDFSWEKSARRIIQLYSSLFK